MKPRMVDVPIMPDLYRRNALWSSFSSARREAGVGAAKAARGNMNATMVAKRMMMVMMSGSSKSKSKSKGKAREKRRKSE